MINLTLRAYFKNQLTVFDIETRTHLYKLKEIFSSEEIENVIGGKTFKNLIRMDRLNSEEYRKVEDCLNNGGRSCLKEIITIDKIGSYDIYTFSNGLIVRIKK